MSDIQNWEDATEEEWFTTLNKIFGFRTYTERGRPKASIQEDILILCKQDGWSNRLIQQELYPNYNRKTIDRWVGRLISEGKINPNWRNQDGKYTTRKTFRNSRTDC